MMKNLRFPDELQAVYNSHVNNARARALECCRAMFGEKDENFIRLEKDYTFGIMIIFQQEPNPVTKLFTSLCFIFANGIDSAHS